ncbi:hypothetical protein G3R49_04680 [Shewanella sp. WXL01]|uniref:Secreted protein n=1 Tax=Shewanella maritima TaxID=2520507 RepID=A0A411PFA5_9GAMM|nr:MULTISPECIES: hypothetical protein [Shewanella]NKF49867.1 hypothetical protein [Shewanella sp. WXL01]QBF82070.1 hypothetical protein EXU30_04645 [Shewanella maritima]
MNKPTQLALIGGLILLSTPLVVSAVDKSVPVNQAPQQSHVLPAIGSGEQEDLGMPQNVQQLTKFAKQFGFLPPQDWKLAFHEILGDMFMAEFIPANESLNDWSGMVCMQGFKGLANDVDPERFLDTMADKYRDHCEGEIIYHKLGGSKVDDLTAVHGILGCTVMPNIHHATPFAPQTFLTKLKGEIGYFTVVSGSEDMYLIHKSMRTKTFTVENAPITVENYREFMAKD